MTAPPAIPLLRAVSRVVALLACLAVGPGCGVGYVVAQMHDRPYEALATEANGAYPNLDRPMRFGTLAHGPVFRGCALSSFFGVEFVERKTLKEVPVCALGQWGYADLSAAFLFTDAGTGDAANWADGGTTYRHKVDALVVRLQLNVTYQLRMLNLGEQLGPIGIGGGFGEDLIYGGLRAAPVARFDDADPIDDTFHRRTQLSVHVELPLAMELLRLRAYHTWLLGPGAEVATFAPGSTGLQLTAGF